MASYLITGSSRGIGLFLATQLAALPSSQISTIFATARSESNALKDLITQSSSRVIFVSLETTSKASVASAVAEVESKLDVKGLDVLINNARIYRWSSTKGITEMLDLQDHLNTNVVARQTSAATHAPSPKLRLNMLTVQYAINYEKEGFTISVISPGWLKTDLGTTYADLEVDVGVKATLSKIFTTGKEQNGEHLCMLVEGYEKRDGPNQYDGVHLPW